MRLAQEFGLGKYEGAQSMTWLLIGLLLLNAAAPYAAYKFSVKPQEGVWKA